MTDWTDITSFSQGQTDRTPKTWQIKAGVLRIVVHRHIHHAPDVWLLSCDPWWDCKPLQNKDAEMAKAEAISMVETALYRALKVLRR